MALYKAIFYEKGRKISGERSSLPYEYSAIYYFPYKDTISFTDFSIVAVKCVFQNGRKVFGIQFWGTDSSCYVDWADNVEEHLNEDAIRISPNPVKDYLNIELANKTEENKVIIYAVEGLKIFEKTFQGKDLIDLRHLPIGIYSLTAWNEKRKITKKVMKE